MKFTSSGRRGLQRIVVCFPQVPFVRGGAELHVESLCLELKGRGFTVDMVKLPFCWDKSHLLQNVLIWRLVHIAGDLVIGTKFPSYFVKYPNKVIWLFHQHRPVYDLYGTKYSEFGHESGDEEIRGVIHGGDTKAIREAKRVFTVSQNVSRRLVRYNGIQAEPLYHPSPFYKYLHFEEFGDFIFLPTRLELNKRPRLLLEAMRATRSDVRCLIAGSGPLEVSLRKDIERWGLNGRVKLIDWVSDPGDLSRLYARCLAVFYAPYDEDYGYVTLEAFCSKKPVITTTDAGGVLEFVTDQETGFVVESSPEALAERIDLLAERRGLCKLMGQAGYERVKDISWDKVIPQLVEERP